MENTYLGAAHVQKGTRVILVNKSGRYCFIYKPEVEYLVEKVERPFVYIKRGSHRLLRVPLAKVISKGTPTVLEFRLGV